MAGREELQKKVHALYVLNLGACATTGRHRISSVGRALGFYLQTKDHRVVAGSIPVFGADGMAILFWPFYLSGMVELAFGFYLSQFDLATP